jgi:hypothetical protein
MTHPQLRPLALDALTRDRRIAETTSYPLTRGSGDHLLLKEGATARASALLSE